MKVYTETGSVYEIEPKPEGRYRVRRLVNGAPAADNVRATQQWREALTVSKPIVGQPLLIAWAWRGDYAESTVTSLVVFVATGDPN